MFRSIANSFGKSSSAKAEQTKFYSLNENKSSGFASSFVKFLGQYSLTLRSELHSGKKNHFLNLFKNFLIDNKNKLKSEYSNGGSDFSDALIKFVKFNKNLFNSNSKTSTFLSAFKVFLDLNKISLEENENKNSEPVYTTWFGRAVQSFTNAVQKLYQPFKERQQMAAFDIKENKDEKILEYLHRTVKNPESLKVIDGGEFNPANEPVFKKFYNNSRGEYKLPSLNEIKNKFEGITKVSVPPNDRRNIGLIHVENVYEFKIPFLVGSTQSISEEALKTNYFQKRFNERYNRLFSEAKSSGEDVKDIFVLGGIASEAQTDTYYEESELSVEEQYENFIKLLLVLIKDTFNNTLVTNYNIKIHYLTEEDGKEDQKTRYSSTKNNGNQIHDLVTKLTRWMRTDSAKAEKGYYISEIVIQSHNYDPNYVAARGKVPQSITNIQKHHYIIDPSWAIQNCFYISIWMGWRSIVEKNNDYLKKSKSTVGECARKLKDKTNEYLTKIGIENLNRDSATLTDMTKTSLYFYKHKKQSGILALDNTFKDFKLFHNGTIYDPVDNKEEFYNLIDENTITIQLQNNNSHAVAVIRKSHIDEKDFQECKFINDIKKQEEKKEVEEKARVVDDNVLIQKPKRFCFNIDPRIAAYDIEASPDVKTGVFTPYMIGLAYNVCVKETIVDEKGEAVKRKINKKTYKMVDGKEVENIDKKTRTDKAYRVVDQKVHIFEGLDCIDQYFDFLYANRAIFNGYTFYAHNGGKFDIDILLKYYLSKPNCKWTSVTDKFIEQNKSIIKIELKTDSCKILLLDSIRMLPDSLDSITNDFDVKHKKLKDEVDHDKITLDNWNSKEYHDKLVKYLEHDCMGLLEVMTQFQKDVFENFGIDIRTITTSASLSKKVFFNKYYDEKKYPVYKLSDKIDSFIRKDYYGGRVEIFKQALVEDVYYYDFTSLYPFCGTYNLPYGVPVYHKFSSENPYPENFFGFVKVRITTKNEKALPLHGIKHKGKLIFPIIKNPVEVVLFSEEIKYGRNIYNYEFIEGYQFKKASWFEKFNNDVFKMKEKADEDGEDAKKQIYKIIINSGYGFWGIKKDRESIINIKDATDVKKFIDEGKLHYIAYNGNFISARVEQKIDIKESNVAVSAAISSYSRVRLYRAMTEVMARGHKIYYCDTDSIITSCNVVKDPSLKRNFMWDGVGKAMGALKNELNSKIKNAIFKKQKKEIIEQNKGMEKSYVKQLISKMKKDLDEKEKTKPQMAFNKAYIIAPKQYYVEYIDEKTSNKTVVNKCKGIKNYKVEDEKTGKKEDFLSENKFAKYFTDKNHSIEQKQMQFRNPKSNLASETDFCSIRKAYIPKRVKMNYTKGVVDANGDVTPLVI